MASSVQFDPSQFNYLSTVLGTVRSGASLNIDISRLWPGVSACGSASRGSDSRQVPADRQDQLLRHIATQTPPSLQISRWPEGL